MIPSDISSIKTNLGQLELQEVTDALRITSQPEIYYIIPVQTYGDYCEAKFMFRHRMYIMLEVAGHVTALKSVD